MSESGRLNPRSLFDANLFPSHSGSPVSSKQLEIPAEKYVYVKGGKLVSPGSVRSNKAPARLTLKDRLARLRWAPDSKISRPVKSRAVRATVKRGKIKQTHKNKCK